MWTQHGRNSVVSVRAHREKKTNTAINSELYYTALMYQVYKYKNKIQETKVMRRAKRVIYFWYLTELLSSGIQWKQLLKTKTPPQMSRPTVKHVQFGTTGTTGTTSASTFLEHKSALNGWRQTLSMQIYYFQQNSKFPNASAVSGSNNMFMSPCWPVVLIEQLVLLDSERLAVESKSPPALIKARCNSGLHKVRMN